MGRLPTLAPQQCKRSAPQPLVAADPLPSFCWHIPHNSGSLRGVLMAKKTFSKAPSVFSTVSAFPRLTATTEPFSKAGFGGILALILWSVHPCSSLDRGIIGCMHPASRVKKGMICTSPHLQEEHLGFLWVK